MNTSAAQSPLKLRDAWSVAAGIQLITGVARHDRTVALMRALDAFDLLPKMAHLQLAAYRVIPLTECRKATAQEFHDIVRQAIKHFPSLDDAVLVEGILVEELFYVAFAVREKGKRAVDVVEDFGEQYHFREPQSQNYIEWAFRKTRALSLRRSYGARHLISNPSLAGPPCKPQPQNPLNVTSPITAFHPSDGSVCVPRRNDLTFVRFRLPPKTYDGTSGIVIPPSIIVSAWDSAVSTAESESS